MVEKGWLGNKVKQGFYKEVRTAEGNREFWSLNLKTLDYEAPVKVRFESIGKVKDAEDLGEKLKIMIAAEDRAGQLVQSTYLSRACPMHPIGSQRLRIPQNHWMMPCVGDLDMMPVHLKCGICWVSRKRLAAMDAAGFPAAKWVETMVSAGNPTFYQYEAGTKVGVYNPTLGKYEPIKRPASLVLLKEQKVISKNPGATLYDLGDGVACVEFHTKMNSLDEDIANMIIESSRSSTA